VPGPKYAVSEITKIIYLWDGRNFPLLFMKSKVYGAVGHVDSIDTSKHGIMADAETTTTETVFRPREKFARWLLHRKRFICTNLLSQNLSLYSFLSPFHSIVYHNCKNITLRNTERASWISYSTRTGILTLFPCRWRQVSVHSEPLMEVIHLLKQHEKRVDCL
jgi:hypothetical protein